MILLHIETASLFLNLLWLSIGIFSTLAVIGIVKKVNAQRSHSQSPSKLQTPVIDNNDATKLADGEENEESDSSTVVSVDSPSDQSPKAEKIWEPAIVAVRKNLSNIFSLLGGVSASKIDNMEEWKNLLISIHNDELIDMWRDVIKQPNLWITYLQTFGIQQDLTLEFTYLPEYEEMYSCIDEDFKAGYIYTVISPCWIYTDQDNNQTVALRGKVTKKHSL